MLSDKEHLNLLINWLIKAQNNSDDNGVSAMYEADNQIWQKSYPETTGYIIPTLYEYSKLDKNDLIKNLATKLADWEIDIQSLNGGTGEFVGFYMTNTTKPRMFNTGQVILGLIAAYNETNDNKYLESAIRAGNYISENTNESGYWDFSNFNTPKTYNIRVAWALMELFLITNEIKIKITSERIINWVISETMENGYIKKNNFSEYNEMAFTHLLGYSLVGLLKVYNIKNFDVNYKKILDLMVIAADNINDLYINKNKYNNFPSIGLPSFINQNWEPITNWSCITGNIQIEYFMRYLSSIIKSNKYLETADNILSDTKKVHIVSEKDDDPNLVGGLFGSYPINEKYCPFQIPNWGVKFFADSIMQKLNLKNNRFLG